MPGGDDLRREPLDRLQDRAELAQVHQDRLPPDAHVGRAEQEPSDRAFAGVLR
jgi:hypothetical protein